MIRQLCMLIVFFIVCGHNPVDARINVFSTGDVIVHYEPSLRNAAQETAEVYQDSKVELEETFGWTYNARPTVILVKNNNEFNKITGYSYIVALAIPQKNLIIIDYSKMGHWPLSLKRTLKHEICHLMLHYHIPNEQLPKWLDEGIAQWVSDGMMELLINSKRQSLDDAILAGNYLPLSELIHHFPQDRRSLWLAYEESKSLVEYIVQNFGEKGLLKILNYLKNDQNFNAAVLKSISIPMDEIEKRWHDHMKRRVNIFNLLSAYLYEVLFVIGALLTIAGFIRFIFKKRAYKVEDD